MEARVSDRLWSLDELVERTSAWETKMDWTVELHPDDGGDTRMIDLPNFEAVLACIKEHKEKGFLGTLGVHAQVQPTDGERAAVIVAGGMPMWADHGLGSN